MKLLQPLFNEPILTVRELTPGYENHSSDVWLVTTASEEVVVRTSKATDEPDGAFWGGCGMTFGLDPRNVHAMEAVNNTLCSVGIIRVPRVLGKGVMDREYVIVEKLEGEMISSFIGQPHEMLYSLGVGLAQIHAKRMPFAGNPSGTFRVERKDFHRHLASSMAKMVEQFYSTNPQITTALPEMQRAVESLPIPESTSFVLVDLDPSQFLTDGNTVTGLVDTEAYVLAPRELDLIALEYVLDEKSAASFRAGYESVEKMPDLSECRRPYRYLYRLIEIQGREDLDRWLHYPILL